jgi:hypothetical protein
VNWWVGGGVVLGVAVLGWLLQRFGLIDLRVKGRKGGGFGGMVTMVDEVFAPTKHEAAIEADRETRMPAPAPLPGDGDKGYGVRIVIDLPKDEGRSP